MRREKSSSPFDSDVFDESDRSDDSELGQSPASEHGGLPDVSSVGPESTTTANKKKDRGPASTSVKGKEIIRSMAHLCKILELTFEPSLHEACAKETPLPTRIELFDRVLLLLNAALELRDLPSPFAQYSSEVHRYLHVIHQDAQSIMFEAAPTPLSSSLKPEPVSVALEPSSSTSAETPKVDATNPTAVRSGPLVLSSLLLFSDWC